MYNFTELFEWLFKNKNKNISGYSRVLYSGITNVRMGKIIKKIIKKHYQFIRNIQYFFNPNI